MKTNRLISIAAVVLTLSSFSASAQMPRPERPEGMPGPEHHQMMLTPRQRAEQRTNEMDKVVRLDEKQYKKIYKIFLKEAKFRKILSVEQYDSWRKLHPDPSGVFFK